MNNSYKLTCLQCSFMDNQLSEYIQCKGRKTAAIPVKYAVSQVGLQQDGTWVLGDNTYISPEGELVSVEWSKHVWLGSMFRGAGVANDSNNCCISQPLSNEPLRALIQNLKIIMKQFSPLCTYNGR